MTIKSLRALPIRVEPLFDETFLGYCHRVADELGISTAMLLNTLADPRPNTPWAARLRRWRLAITPETQSVLAGFFNLDDDEVAELFPGLSRRGLHQIPASQRSSFDPFTSSESHQPPYDELPLGLRRHRTFAGCPAAGHLPQGEMSAGFQFRLVCTVHGLYLRDTKFGPERGKPVGPTVVAAQEEVMAVANGTQEPPQGLTREEYLHYVSRSLILHRNGDALVGAVRELHTHAPTWATSCDYSAGRTRHGHNTDHRIYVMPDSLYHGDLSDLAYPLDLYVGRVIASAQCLGLEPLGLTSLPTNTWQATRELVDRLETEGRLEAWWAAIHRARPALESHIPTWRERRLQRQQFQAHSVTSRANRTLLNAWLDDWCAIPHFQRPDPDQLQAFDHKYRRRLLQVIQATEGAA